MSLNKAQFLQNDKLPTEEVPLPKAWGDGATIRVQGLSAKSRFEWALMREKALNGEQSAEPTAYLVALAAVDDDGNRLFQGQDADAIAELRGDVIDDIASVVMRLSGLTVEAPEEAEGNSDATPSGDSVSS